MPAVIGANCLPSTLDSSVAPAYAPTAPGIPMRATVRQCTLPKRQWLAPDTSAVPIFAAWITADAAAADAPAATRTDVPITPNPMPRDPSMSCARNPAATNTINRSTGLPPPASRIETH